MPEPTKLGAARLQPYEPAPVSTRQAQWWNWIQRYVLKWVMFGFVLGIDIWWTRNVLRMVWLSGSGTYFHLDNSILITLVSTSVGNFLALVAIVAKNLFPTVKKTPKQPSKRSG